MQKKADITHIYSSHEGNPEKGNIYLGNIGVLNHMEQLKEKHVDCILTVLDDWAYPKYKVKEKIQKGNISVSHRINLEDDQDANIYPEFEKTYHFLKKQLETTNVFVHCFGGNSRSPSIVISFLMKEKGLTRQEANKMVRSKRVSVDPNVKFWEQLLHWEKHLEEQRQKQ